MSNIMIRASLATCMLWSLLVACGGSDAPAPAGSGGSGGSAGMTGGSGGITAQAGMSSGGQNMMPNGGDAGTASGSGGGAGSSAGSSGSGGGDSGPNLPKRVLLYTFSTLEIASVPAQVTALTEALEAWGYEVESNEDPASFTDQNLARFGAVGMINTCFEPFGAGQSGDAETAALKRFVEAGGGLFGTHCASVTYQSASPPKAYNALIGGRGNNGFFEGASTCRKLTDHPTTMMLPATFDYTGNLDNTDFLAEDATVLVQCKWSGGAMLDVAVSWHRSEGKGRVFFTNFAKEDVDLENSLGDQHILPGLSWVLWR
jgi:type 1 glutamine amidotransferase